LIPLDDVTPRDEAAWRDLAARTLEPNPFFEPDFVLAAHAHIPDSGTALFVTEQSGRWTGALPLRAGRFRTFRSWCHPYVFLGTPLVADEAAFAEFVEAALRTSRARLLFLDLLAASSFPREALADRDVALVADSEHERAALERRAAGGYLDHMSRHQRKELNRLRRRLEERLGEPLLVRDRGDDPDAVELFLQVEQSGWKGRRGTALASVPEHAAFFRDLCTRFGTAARLQLLTLEAGKRIVAVKCNFAAGEALFCFKIGYDEELRAFSPGLQLERANVEAFHEQRRERWMDSCAVPENEMINRLWPDRRRITSVVLAPRGAGSAVARRAFRVKRRDRPVGGRGEERVL
jgi:CelD/BcsL family acetyltransferase involved in cellulose biosynthesis